MSHREKRVEDARRPDFWEAQYVSENTGWDLGGVTETLRAVLKLGLLEDRERVLVPGAGRGYDAIELARRGHDVVAVDFAESAIGAIRAQADAADVSITARQRDLFDAGDLPNASFDAVYEYTCYVAIDPAMRNDYAQLVTRLVRPGGRLLFLAFPLGRTEPGPPHGLTIEELRERFADGWRWLFDSEPETTTDGRKGMERLVVLERR